MIRWDSYHGDELDQLIKDARIRIRKWLNDHTQQIAHDSIQRDIELDFLSSLVSIITKKWAVRVLWELEIHPSLHFNALKRQLNGISTRSLSETLGHLEENNLLTRSVEMTRPPRVTYALSEKGKGFIELSFLLLRFLT